MCRILVNAVLETGKLWQVPSPFPHRCLTLSTFMGQLLEKSRQESAERLQKSLFEKPKVRSLLEESWKKLRLRE